MDDQDFDRSLVASAFRLIAEKGWARLSLVEAAHHAGLSLDRVRARFPSRLSLLWRFGLLADQASLAETDLSETVRDRLFGMIMKRIDVLQAHRGGVLALLRALPSDPMALMLVNSAGLSSMGWILDAAGVAGLTGPLGLLRRKGLLAVWLCTVNAWRRDESADLSSTMAALDQALSHAERAASWLPGIGLPDTGLPGTGLPGGLPGGGLPDDGARGGPPPGDVPESDVSGSAPSEPPGPIEPPI